MWKKLSFYSESLFVLWVVLEVSKIVDVILVVELSLIEVITLSNYSFRRPWLNSLQFFWEKDNLPEEIVGKSELTEKKHRFLFENLNLVQSKEAFLYTIENCPIKNRIDSRNKSDLRFKNAFSEYYYFRRILWQVCFSLIVKKLNPSAALFPPSPSPIPHQLLKEWM